MLLGTAAVEGVGTGTGDTGCPRKGSPSGPVAVARSYGAVPRDARRLCPQQPELWPWSRAVLGRPGHIVQRSALGPSQAASPGEAAVSPSGRPRAQLPGPGWGGDPRSGGRVLGPGPWGPLRACRLPWCSCASAQGSGLRVRVAVRPLPGHTPSPECLAGHPRLGTAPSASEAASAPGATC